ncbi:MAG: LON peptidase substrate-binding domain-containing protein [Betaproteobacteria bacterium]
MSAAMNILELPLFPLDTVLFPHGLLPLRIFEVRYLDMIKRCHQSSTPFGVVSLTERSQVLQAGGGGERFNRVGTLARIIELSSPQAGLLIIRCQGEQRFAVQRSEKLRHGLWVADAELLPADAQVPIPPDLQNIVQMLRRLLQQLQDKQVPADQMPLLAPYQFDDCSWVANRWCELLPLPVEMKQQLMTLDNPLVRLELVGDLLERSGWS